MSKKKTKKKAQQQTFLSPVNYLKEKARTLEIGKCYMTDDIMEIGEGQVVVTRLHKSGKTSVAIYMVDTYCLGVKDSVFKLRMDEFELANLLSHISIALGLHEVTYNEAHNMVYGAIAFAEEAGIKPHKNFSWTQYMLEEDTDEIPLIEFEYGKDGKHFLVAHSNIEANKYLPTLRKNLGDNFDYVIDDGDSYLDDDEDEAFDEDEDAPEKDEDFMPNGLNRTSYDEITTEYTYKHPEYPVLTALENPQLKDILYSDTVPTDRDIDTMLALPHDSLRRDLEAVLLDCMAKTCDGITDGMWNKDFAYEAMSAVTMLGEVGNGDSSLDTLLEMLRQPNETFEYYFGDFMTEVFITPLYTNGQKRLDKFMDFFKEEGLYDFSKTTILSVIEHIVNLQPERRDEIIEWLREALRFATEKLPEAQFVDSTTTGFLVGSCVEAKAKELLPEIKAMFDTGFVDTNVVGDYDETERIINSSEKHFINNFEPDVHKRFAELR